MPPSLDAVPAAAGMGAAAVAPVATRADKVATLAPRALDFAGGIDVWVSNAGVGARSEPSTRCRCKPIDR